MSERYKTLSREQLLSKLWEANKQLERFHSMTWIHTPRPPGEGDSILDDPQKRRIAFVMETSERMMAR